jgi:hypothetical protein
VPEANRAARRSNLTTKNPRAHNAFGAKIKPRYAVAVKTMEDLFVDALKDIYYAEKQIQKALPGMVKKAGSVQLRDALESHRQETQGQVDRLEKVFKLMDVPARRFRWRRERAWRSLGIIHQN